MPSFVSPVAFVAPNAVPRFTTGRVVIHSDDGNIGDWTHFWPVFRAQHRRSQFLGARLAPFCPDINSGTIGTGSNKMTWANVRAIQSAGGEILSHGRFHLGYADYALAAGASAGATTVQVSAGMGTRVYLSSTANVGITHEIVEGATVEAVTVASAAGDVLTLSAPLANAFTTAAVIRLSEASMLANITACSDDAEAEGIAPIAHHVWTWHDNSATSRARVAGILTSARGGDQTFVDPAGSVDFYRLNGRLGPAATEVVDAMLDAVIAADGVFIAYAHGEQDAGTLAWLTYLIEQAIARGVRIVTQSEAVAYLTAA